MCASGLGTRADSLSRPTRLPVPQVTFIIYLTCLMSFVGWFIFSIYVGIGFIALPMDCISVSAVFERRACTAHGTPSFVSQSFIHRPKVLTFGEAKAQKKVLKTVRLLRAMTSHAQYRLASILTLFFSVPKTS